MTAIEWKSDWRPSELVLNADYAVRERFTGSVHIGRAGQWSRLNNEPDFIRIPLDKTIRNCADYDLGPPCRIDDAAEVARMRRVAADWESMRGSLSDIGAALLALERSLVPCNCEYGFDHDPSCMVPRVADIRALVQKALSPERQEAGS